MNPVLGYPMGAWLIDEMEQDEDEENEDILLDYDDEQHDHVELMN